MSLIERLRSEADSTDKLAAAVTNMATKVGVDVESIIGKRDGTRSTGAQAMREAATQLEAMQAEIVQANVDLLVVADAVNPEAGKVLRRIASNLQASLQEKG